MDRLSLTLFRTVPSSTPYGLCLPFSKIGGSQPQRKTAIVIISNLADTFTGSIRKKAMKNFGEKGTLANPGTVQIFGVPPIISGVGKATNFKFCPHIHRIDQRNKSLLKISAKVAVGVLRDSKIFRAPIYRTHRAVIFAVAQLSCLFSSFY